MGQIRGFLRSDFSAFGAPAPNALKSVLKKPGFVPFGANLTHFGAKPTTPALNTPLGHTNVLNEAQSTENKLSAGNN